MYFSEIKLYIYKIICPQILLYLQNFLSLQKTSVMQTKIFRILLNYFISLLLTFNWSQIPINFPFDNAY